MIRYLTAFLAALCGCVLSQAQPGCGLSVRIRLAESHSLLPVSEAVIYIDELKQGWDTDEHGILTIDNICAGTYTVHIHSLDIRDTTLSLSIPAAGDYLILLHHNDKMLQRVVITDPHKRYLLQSQESLDAKSLDAASGQNLGDLLRKVSGVTTLSNGATIAKPVIHGLHSNRVLILNNGVRQEDQQWGTEHAPDIDPFLAANITVLKGAAGVRYGTDAIGGVILVEPEVLPAQSGWSGALNTGFFSNNRMGVISGRLDHRFRKLPALAFRVQGTWKQGGNYLLPGGVHAANTGIKEQDYSATLSWRKAHYNAELFYSHFGNDLGIYTGTHVGTREDLERAINSPVPLVPAGFSYRIGRPRQHIEHDLFRFKANAEHQLGTWSLTYAYQHNFRQEYDVMRVDNGRAQLNLNLNTQSLNLNLDHKRIGPLKGQLGIDVSYQDNFFRNGDRVFIPSYTSWTPALYLIERYSWGAKTLEAGFRYDYRHYNMFNPEGPKLENVEYRFDYRNASGTLAFRQQMAKGWEWSATLANAWRAPQANELFSAGLHQGAARVELGNKNLKPEISSGLNLNLRYDPDRKLKADLTLYSQAIQQFIYLSPGPDLLTIRGYYKTFSFRQTDALLSGADLSLSYKWDRHLSADLKGSLLRARDISRKDWLILMPSDRYSLGLRYSRDISDTWKECFLSLNGQYVLQQRRLPGDFDSVDYPRPPAAYFLLEAQAGTTIYAGKQALHLSIAATNLLDQRYRDYMDAFRYFLNQPGRNIIFRLRIPFTISSN